MLAECFGLLHELKRYDAAVEGLLAAIRHNQGQPWMYEVLPLEMKLASRPQHEIDRALLSRVDFTANDIQQLLITASLLSRMQAWDRSIELCRESVRHNPWQPVVWLKARTIADRSGNPEHVLWARTGILKHVWSGDAKQHHDEARQALAELIADAEKQGHAERAIRIQDALNEALSCDLIVRAEWAGDADVDLIVSEPGDCECSHRNTITKNGGLLSVTSDRNQRRPAEEYRCREAPNGDYAVKVRLIRGRVITGRVIIRITRYAGTSREQTQTLRVPVAAGDADVRVSIRHGRG